MSNSHDDPESAGFSTRAIHHGYDPASAEGALTPPLHLTSTFAFETAEQGGEIFAGERPGYLYSRIGNPTLDLLERRFASLENAEAALATASGMGAISSTLWTLLGEGAELIADQTLYGCTFSYLHHGLTRYGVKVQFLDLTQPEQVAEAITSGTRAIYFETPANPNMRIIDIEAISSIAHRHGAKVVVDNTYATPYLTRPLERGADLVVHSATKYLGGHGDLIAGMVGGSAELVEEIRLFGLKDMTGAVMSPFTAHLILRGLKTLQLRMERHCASAQTIACWLEQQPGVTAVHYPGLESFPQHQLASKQMDRFGGMIAFEVAGGVQAGIALMNGLTLIQRAVSLGDTESLVQHPASMTHSTYTPEERREHGIDDGLIRMSVGLEEPQDLIADLAAAFEHLHLGSAA